MTAMCHQLTGQCQCKDNVEGDRCERYQLTNVLEKIVKLL